MQFLLRNISQCPLQIFSRALLYFLHRLLYCFVFFFCPVLFWLFQLLFWPSCSTVLAIVVCFGSACCCCRCCCCCSYLFVLFIWTPRGCKTEPPAPGTIQIHGHIHPRLYYELHFMKMQLPARCRCRWRFATAAAALRVHCKYFIIAQFRQLIPPAYECIGGGIGVPCHAMPWNRNLLVAARLQEGCK